MDGPHKGTFSRLHIQLRDNLLANVAKQYEKTGLSLAALR
jgi:hypothetical protein